MGEAKRRYTAIQRKRTMVREKLANYAHKTWAGWMNYIFEKSAHNDDGTVTIPAWAVDRWKRQIKTPYTELPEDEKETDRLEADEILGIVRNITTDAIGVERSYSGDPDNNPRKDVDIFHAPML